MDADRRYPGARTRMSEGADRWLSGARISSCETHNPPPIHEAGDLRLKREVAAPPPMHVAGDLRLKREAADPPTMREAADPRLKHGSPDPRSSAVQLLFQTYCHR